jgi:hypothetical protein
MAELTPFGIRESRSMKVMDTEGSDAALQLGIWDPVYEGLDLHDLIDNRQVTDIDLAPAG